jgi:hypothetical protein
MAMLEDHIAQAAPGKTDTMKTPGQMPVGPGLDTVAGLEGF